MKLLLKLIVLVTFYLFEESCNDKNKSAKTFNKSDSTVTENIAPPSADNPIKKEIGTSTGKTLVIKESHPRGASLSDITVEFKNDPASGLSIYDKDPISGLFLADLDSNGFDELYLITHAVGSGSYGNILGFVSNKDKSLSFITFPDIEEKDLQKQGLFYGYEGHDTFYIDQKKLIRSFKVNGATENKKKLSYHLKKTETGYSLIPVS
jgi:hypothetical protein